MADTQLSIALARPDPLLTFRWVVKSIPGNAAAFGIDYSYVETIELPFSNVRSTGVFFGGGYSYFPEFHDTAAFNVTFYGDSEGRVLSYLWNWKQKVKSFGTGLYNLPDEFKEDWTIALLNAKGAEVAQFKYIGCWPADTAPITLDQEGSSRITHSQTFSLDSMELTIGGKTFNGTI